MSGLLRTSLVNILRIQLWQYLQKKPTEEKYLYKFEAPNKTIDEGNELIVTTLGEISKSNE